MEVLQIGSIAILLKWVLLGTAAIIGLIFIRVWLKRTQEAKIGKQVHDLLSNSLFVGFFAWKGSLLLLEPGLILKSPLSLLYFTGGSDGLIIAILCAMVYFFVRARKLAIGQQLAVQSLFLFSFATLGLYHISFAIFLQEDGVFHVLVGAVALMIVFVNLFNKKLQVRKTLFLLIILFSFGYEILSMVLLHMEDKILFFSSDQWFFFGLILLSLYYMEK